MVTHTILSAEDTVAAQLKAYNARNIDAFMACWHPDAEIFAHPDEILAHGHPQIRARHELRFQEPNLYAELLSRLVMSETQVVDRESVTRTMEGRKVRLDVVAIYEVRDGLIRRAWFLSGTPKDIV